MFKRKGGGAKEFWTMLKKTARLVQRDIPKWLRLFHGSWFIRNQLKVRASLVCSNRKSTWKRRQEMMQPWRLNSSYWWLWVIQSIILAWSNSSQGPGIMFASGSNAPMLDLSFPTEVVVTGLKFTTHKDRALQRVRIRANSDPANPDDFETPPQPLHSIQNVSQHRNASI